MLSHLEDLLNARSIDEAWKLHVAAMAGFGFDRLIYGHTFETGPEVGSVDDMLILSNHGAGYLDRFIGGGLFRDAPMLRWAGRQSGAASWSEIERNASLLTRREKEVVAFNRKMNVTAGYTISFGPVAPCGRALISLTARAGLDQERVDAIWKGDGPRIELLNQIAHLKISTLPRARGSRRLTARQREVIRHLGDGKSSVEIAAIMGLSLVTVDKHLRLARERLGARSSAQALLKAALQDHIFLSDP